MGDILKNKRGARSRFAAAVMIVLSALTALLFASCASSDGVDGYTVISPVVSPGDALDADDFIMVSEFSDKRYTAETEDDLDTSVPGVFEAVITVSDGHGEKRDHVCVYMVRSYLRDSVRLEAGEMLTVERFINTDIPSHGRYEYAFADETTAETSFALGTYQIGVLVNGELHMASLIVEDTTPPQASPVTVHITNPNISPRPSDFVADVRDATNVTFTFKEEYDFNTKDDVPVVIVMTDEGGNVTEIESRATCAVDTTPPQISGVHDITVVVGGTVSYKDGITVTDDSGETPTLQVDNSRVNLSVVGTYEITYTARDSSMNETIVRANVIVVEKPKVSEEEMMQLAQQIYDTEIETEPDMTAWDIAKAIYDWTHINIKYVNETVDKNDPVGAAYDGLKSRKGDCFTYMAVSRVLLQLADIECRQIERLKYDDEANHYWLLVDIGDGWYHFDSCLHFTGMAWDSFMRTDAELEAYCKEHGIEYYYRFDKSKYPARGTESYYE